jgi:mono/diheme cytochrome c family protein
LLETVRRDYHFLLVTLLCLTFLSGTNAMTTRIAMAFESVIAACLLAGAGRAEGDDLFRTTVAPILEKRCVKCHGNDTPKGGLSLTSSGALLRGGESGPAVEPGKPDESLLIEMVSGDKPEMPRTGQPLGKEQVAALRRWVKEGARWPEGVVLYDRRLEDDRWWAIQPLDRPAIPDVKNRSWTRTPIDAFILSRCEVMGLRPAPEADRRTLIRRLTYDLHGLPPTPDEIDAFEQDRTPEACGRLVDRLLASPHYGERWGRHWLDVVHYGDTHGYDKDKRRDHAWPYRDYVIKCLNDDLPYDRFIREQIAGDLVRPGESNGVIATGFIAAGPWDFVGHVELREGTGDKLKTRVLDRDDMVTNTMSTFQSVTVHCARCHDHKFDPIPQRDYYRLQAVFADIDRGDREHTPDHKLVYAVLPVALRPIHLLRRGEVEQPSELVQPGALSCLASLAGEFVLSKHGHEEKPRAALANWIASPSNVLTWRSIANRVWHYHFGRGIVDTPNDFGRNGSRPTHPELLDWLGVEFRDGGKSLKVLHRMMVSSAVYRQSTRDDPAYAKIDADNRFLWRMNRTRLDAEELRDSVLAVSGTLDTAMGGPGIELFRFKNDHSPIYDHSDPEAIDNPRVRRRTVYRFIVRSVPNPFLDCLDSADPNLNAPTRNTTITALQSLALLNDIFMIRQSQYFARRLEELSTDPRRRIEAAVLLALGRRPVPEEANALENYASKHGLANACRFLLNTNEFAFID